MTYLTIIVFDVQLQQVDLMGITIKSLAEIEKEVRGFHFFQCIQNCIFIFLL